MFFLSTLSVYPFSSWYPTATMSHWVYTCESIYNKCHTSNCRSLNGGGRYGLWWSALPSTRCRLWWVWNGQYAVDFFKLMWRQLHTTRVCFCLLPSVRIPDQTRFYGIFWTGILGFVTGCTCSVLGLALTTCLLYVGPCVGISILNKLICIPDEI